VTVQAAIERALAQLSDAHVSSLAACCADHQRPPGRLVDTVSGAPVGGRSAVDELSRAWGKDSTVTGPGIALALRIGLGARKDAMARRSRPVWTGPATKGEQRLTPGVLHELVTDAKQRVLLVSFAAFTLSDLAKDLTAAVKRGCQVDVVFETEKDSAGAFTGNHATPFGTVDGIRRWRWPADQRHDTGAVLHAKLLVIDGRRALVGSANLTHRALTANLEAGLLVEDPDVASSLEQHVRTLMRTDVLQTVK
jgi:phosphatidylserine/phosphatidylglycerophosphate/cardiolipin synthase-like enzyme